MRKIYIPIFCITGGPCGGKTSILRYLRRRFTKLGYKVYIVPEAPTILSKKGFDKRDPVFQFHVLKEIIRLENAIKEKVIAENHPKPIIICDRGTLDGRAYCTEDYFNGVLEEYAYTIPELRDLRYDGVFHLVTAADGALDSFMQNKGNNAVRDEPPEEARLRDSRTQEAYLGHPHVRAIDNSTDFLTKKRRVFEKMCHKLGIPVPLEIERRFLVSRKFIAREIQVPYAAVDITQHYLEQTEEEAIDRVRKRTQYNFSTYAHTRKKVVAKGINDEDENLISLKEYLEYLKQEDLTRSPIEKIRHYFFSKHQYFELDFIHKPSEEKILEIEVGNMNDHVTLPLFVPIIREITGEKAYSNYMLATNKPRI